MPEFPTSVAKLGNNFTSATCFSGAKTLAEGLSKFSVTACQCLHSLQARHGSPCRAAGARASPRQSSLPASGLGCRLGAQAGWELFPRKLKLELVLKCLTSSYSKSAQIRTSLCTWPQCLPCGRVSSSGEIKLLQRKETERTLMWVIFF